MSKLVVRVSTKYAMGLDLKMQKSAFVIVLCLDAEKLSDNMID